MHMLMILLGLLTGSPEAAVPVHLGTSESWEDAHAIREKAGKDWRFFLGANGELISPHNSEDTTLGRVSYIYCTQESNKKVIWLPFLNKPFAEIYQDGSIVILEGRYLVDIMISRKRDKLEKSVHISSALFPDFPTRWPYIKDGVLLPAPPGSILANSLEKNESPPESPSGARGWLILGWNGELISLRQEGRAPKNVLWMVAPNLSNGIELIHSGPQFSGLYAHVTAGGKMNFGADGTATHPLSALEKEITIIDDDNIVPTESFWPFFADTERTRLAIFPSGFFVQPTDTHPDEILVVVRDDKTPQVIRKQHVVF